MLLREQYTAQPYNKGRSGKILTFALKRTVAPKPKHDALILVCEKPILRDAQDRVISIVPT